MKRPIVSCSACDGSGKVPLSEPLFQCLKVLIALGEATAIQIHQKLKEPITRSATNGRLTELENQRLIKRERRGGKYFYKAVLNDTMAS